MNTFYRLALIATALQLSACGGSNDSQTNSTAAPLTATIDSSVSIESATEPKLQLASTSSVGDDAVYRVTTALSYNPYETSLKSVSFGISQTLTFELGQKRGDLVLEIGIDPFTRKNTFTTLTKKHTDSSTKIYDCPEFGGCLSSFSFDPKTGSFTANLNTLKLKNTNSNQVLAFSGELKARLSIAPQTINDIPKTSSTNLILNGKSVDVVAARSDARNPILHRIEAILSDGSILYVPQNFLSDSILLSEQPILEFLSIKDSTRLQFNKTTNESEATFNDAVFHDRFNPEFPNQTIKGQIKTNNTTSSLTLSPYRANQTEQVSVGSYFSKIELINHNQKHLIVAGENENTGISYTLINNSLQSVAFNDASSPDYVFERYTCERNCQGIQLYQNGYDIRFNNTVLTWGYAQRPAGYQAKLTLNGSAVFQGR